MSKGLKMSAILVSAILISACATNRIQKQDLSCKVPKTRYDFGKNRPIRAIKSNNNKQLRYVYNPARNNTHYYSLKNIIRKDKHPDKVVYGKFQIPLRIINDPKDILIGLSRGETLYPIKKEDNGSNYSYIVIKQEVRDDILPKKLSEEAGVSIQEAIKSDQSQKTPFQKSGTFILMMAVLAGLIPLATIKATPKLAQNISFWAATNPWKTRVMFAGTQIALGTAGFLFGERLADNGIHFSELSRDLLLGAFLTSSLLYPVKNTSIKFFKHSYLRQKGFDLAVAISGLMLMVNAGNDPGMRATFTSMVNFRGQEQKSINMMNDYNQAPKQLLYYPKDNQLPDQQTTTGNKEKGLGLKYFLTFLAILGALTLGILVAAAACSLSCNGMVGLAYVTAIGGGGLIIALAIWAIKSIWHPKRSRMVT